jgi:hypothetical protein
MVRSDKSERSRSDILGRFGESLGEDVLSVVGVARDEGLDEEDESLCRFGLEADGLRTPGFPASSHFAAIIPSRVILYMALGVPLNSASCYSEVSH